MAIVASCDTDERVLSIGAIHPLPDSLATTLAIDSAGHFWLGSVEGIRLFAPDSSRMVVERMMAPPPRVIGWREGRTYLRAGDTVFVHGNADTLISRGSFGTNPLVLDPRGRALLQGARSGAVLAHHPDTLAPEWGWAARATPSTALAISPEGDRVYQAVVEDEGDDARLLVRDLQTGRVLHVMTAVAPLEHLEVDRRGWVYGLEQGRRGRAVVALQPRGGEVETVWRHELAGEPGRGPGRLAVGRDRVAVWGVGEEEDLLLLTTEDGSVVGRSAPAPLDGAFDPDGSLWVLRPGVLHRLE